MVGGFLGAGKSTALLKLGRRLNARGYRVGLITNDQGAGLVDTTFLRAQGFPVEEIAGGCFCCRFNSLLEAAQSLTRASVPDVFLAEPVGSCTDLVASVSYPLRRIYGNDFTIAPLSVLVDPVRALRVLGLEEGRRFSDKVLYVYRKQLEEADVIVINKLDLLDDARHEALREELRSLYARARVFSVSARDETGLEAWFEWIATRELEGGAAMELDYDAYAEGEALLGWLNATFRAKAGRPADGDALLLDLAERLQGRLSRQGVEVAHLKMTLSPSAEIQEEVAALSLVRNDYVPELSQSLSEPFEDGELVLNLRAEGPPEILCDALKRVLEELEDDSSPVALRVEHLESFRPARPEPTHRFRTPEGEGATTGNGNNGTETEGDS